MKPKVMIFPLAALIAAACFLTSQSRAISSVRQQEESLRKRLAADSGTTDKASGAGTASSSSRTVSKGPVNWMRLAELTGEYGGAGIFAKQELLRAEKRIQAMSPEELLDALAATTKLEMDGRSRSEIHARLINALAGKDPAAALTYLISPVDDRLFRWGIREDILARWINDDPAAAVRWFDGKIADGSFNAKSVDGRNHQRLMLEGGLLSHLCGNDPEVAARRLSAYPEADRGKIFEYLTTNSRTEDEKQLVVRMELARAALSPQEQSKILTDSLGPVSRGGDYSKIDAFLDTVSATPEERANSIAKAAKERFMQLSRRDQLDTAEIDRFREWAAGHSQEKIDESAGAALAATSSGYRSGHDSVEKIRELLSHYQEASGNDDMLIGFLKGGPFDGDRGKRRLVAEGIRDPEQRAEYLKQMENDPFAQ